MTGCVTACPVGKRYWQKLRKTAISEGNSYDYELY